MLGSTRFSFDGMFMCLCCLLRRNRREHPTIILVVRHPGMRGGPTTLRHIQMLYKHIFLRGLDNPSRPRPCCTLACRCGRGPTQGTCKRELTAEGLLPSMRIWMRIIFMSWETQHRAAVAPPGVATTLTAYNDMFSIIRKKTTENKQHFQLENFVFLFFVFLRFFCFGGIASYWETRRFPVVFPPNPSFDNL